MSGAIKGKDLDDLRRLIPSGMSQARYIADEAKDKDGKVLDVSTWQHDFPKDIPEQLNGYDSCTFFDYRSTGSKERKRKILVKMSSTIHIMHVLCVLVLQKCDI